MPREHLVQQHTHSVEIGAGIHFHTQGLLWAHIKGRAKNQPRLGLGFPGSLRPNELGNTKVKQLEDLGPVFFARHKNVLRLEVPMDHTVVVGMTQAGNNL